MEKSLGRLHYFEMIIFCRRFFQGFQSQFGGAKILKRFRTTSEPLNSAVVIDWFKIWLF